MSSPTDSKQVREQNINQTPILSVFKLRQALYLVYCPSSGGRHHQIHRASWFPKVTRYLLDDVFLNGGYSPGKNGIFFGEIWRCWQRFISSSV
ncbi:MAG: hypothetical protein R2865_14080 [Deinococcales bacterium]